MRWVESFGPLEIEVHGRAGDPDYSVVIHSGALSTTPVLIDAHWGHQEASHIALDVFHRAWTDKKRFLAEERMESRNLSEGFRERHNQWAVQVSLEAEKLGDLIGEAVDAARQSIAPAVDIQAKMDSFYEMMEIGREMAIQRLAAHSGVEEAKKAFTERSLYEFVNQWRLVPSRRFPQAGSWVSR
jgi:hypothetical protein